MMDRLHLPGDKEGYDFNKISEVDSVMLVMYCIVTIAFKQILPSMLEVP